MSTITTARGDIAPEDLGYTSMHEHLNTDLTQFEALHAAYGVPQMPAQMLELRVDNLAFLRDAGATMSKECFTIGDTDFTVAELEFFKQVGGNAVVDASPMELRGDVRQLREASERADVHVVFASGIYVKAARLPGWAEKTEGELYEHFRNEALNGVGDTGIKPGILKTGISTGDPTGDLYPEEVAAIRALGRISAETGLSFHIHTAFPMSHEQVLKVADTALDTGMEPDRLVMIHLDSFLRPWDALTKYVNDMAAPRNISTDLQRAVLDRGVNIGFDSFSATTAILPDDYDRIKGLVDLLRGGYGDHIVLGHDQVTKAGSKTWGYYGFTRFPQLVPQMLTQLGFDDDAYRKLVVDNPARILAH